MKGKQNAHDSNTRRNLAARAARNFAAGSDTVRPSVGETESSRSDNPTNTKSTDNVDRATTVYPIDSPINSAESRADDAIVSGASGNGKRGRGRPRGSASNNSAAGNNNGRNDNRTANQETQSGLGVAAEVEPPPKRKYARKSKDNTSEKFAILTLIAVTVNTTFHTVALKYGQHWNLNDAENQQLSVAIHDAVETLPGSYYAKLVEYLAKFGPWIALGFCAYTIVGRRIAYTLAQRKAESERNTEAGGRTSTNTDNEQQGNVQNDWRTNPNKGDNGYAVEVNYAVN